jgi:F-type H+-transporting ATPase subunit alpha
VEILKQAEFTPYSVEKQIAIMYVGTKNLASKVPVNKIKEFEKDYISQLETRFPELLTKIKTNLDAAAEKELQQLAADVALNFY